MAMGFPIMRKISSSSNRSLGVPYEHWGKAEKEHPYKKMYEQFLGIFMINVPFHTELFIPDGFDRIHVGGLLGRVPTEENPDKRADTETHHDAPPLDENGHVGGKFDGISGSYT